jgi:hypothetical protein
MPYGTLWGSTPWGDGSSITPMTGTADAIALRENVIRVTLPFAAYFTGLLDAEDASYPAKWVVSPVANTTGLEGSTVWPVTVVSVVEVGTDALGQSIIDLYLDRPMTPWPAQYSLQADWLWTNNLAYVFTVTTASIPSMHQKVEPANSALEASGRDFANPQTAKSLLGLPNVDEYLGTYRADDTGDYAYDDGAIGLQKRVLRIGITKKDGFAHLPGWGVGIYDLGKRLLTASERQTKIADYEKQITQDPGVKKGKVQMRTTTNGLATIIVLVEPFEGSPSKYELALPEQ